MKTDDGKLTSHFFVCTNSRKDKASCAGSGAVELRDRLKADLKSNPDCRGLRVNAAGCLGRCEEGIVAVMYPQGKWFTEIQTQDYDKLKELVISSTRSK